MKEEKNEGKQAEVSCDDVADEGGSGEGVCVGKEGGRGGEAVKSEGEGNGCVGADEGMEEGVTTGGGDPGGKKKRHRVHRKKQWGLALRDLDLRVMSK